MTDERVQVTPLATDLLDWWRSAVDWTTFLITVGTILDFLPPVAASLSIIWLLIRICETATVRRLIKRWRDWRNP